MPTIDTDKTGTQTITKMDLGDDATGQRGVVPGGKSSSHSTGDTGIAEAFVWAAPTGAGEITAWSYVGSSFDVTGSNSKDYSVTAYGTVYGHLMASFGGTSEAKIELTCNKVGTNVQFDTYLANVERGWPAGTKAFTGDKLSNMGTLGVTLEPGNQYEIIVRVIASVSVTATGGGTSDFDNLLYINYHPPVSRVCIHSEFHSPPGIYDKRNIGRKL